MQSNPLDAAESLCQTEMRTPDVLCEVESSAPSSSNITIQAQIEEGGEEVLRHLWEPWGELCDESHSEPFARPEWIAAYLQNFEPGARVLLATARQGKRLVAVLPLIRKTGYLERMPVRKLVCPANVHSVRFSFPQIDGESGNTAKRKIWEKIKTLPGWDVLEVPIYLEKGSCHGIFDCAEKDGYQSWTRLYQESPVLYMRESEAGKADWMHGTNRHFRHELRRYQRLLESNLTTKPMLTLHRTLDEKVKEQFFQLEAAGWKGQEGSAIISRGETRGFYEQIARTTAEAGYFCFYSYGHNGDLVAGAYGVGTADVFYPMKISYREELHRCGPGHLMFNAIFEDCANRGVRTVYFGGSQDRYKKMWTPDVQINREGFIFNAGFYPNLVNAIATDLFPRLKRYRDSVRNGMTKLRKAEEESAEQQQADSGSAKR